MFIDSSGEFTRRPSWAAGVGWRQHHRRPGGDFVRLRHVSSGDLRAATAGDLVTATHEVSVGRGGKEPTRALGRARPFRSNQVQPFTDLLLAGRSLVRARPTHKRPGWHTDQLMAIRPLVCCHISPARRSVPSPGTTLRRPAYVGLPCGLAVTVHRPSVPPGTCQRCPLDSAVEGGGRWLQPRSALPPRRRRRFANRLRRSVSGRGPAAEVRGQRASEVIRGPRVLCGPFTAGEHGCPATCVRGNRADLGIQERTS